MYIIKGFRKRKKKNPVFLLNSKYAFMGAYINTLYHNSRDCSDLPSLSITNDLINEYGGKKFELC